MSSDMPISSPTLAFLRAGSSGSSSLRQMLTISPVSQTTLVIQASPLLVWMTRSDISMISPRVIVEV